jgi:5-methylcytosine-specific restriction endonuclease McrA
MPVRICIGNPATGERCKARVLDGSYCPEQAPRHRSPTTRAGAHSRWRTAKRTALRRVRGRCQRCGRVSQQLHVHHITPVSEGGSDRLSNALVRCPACHRQLHRDRAILALPWPLVA